MQGLALMLAFLALSGCTGLSSSGNIDTILPQGASTLDAGPAGPSEDGTRVSVDSVRATDPQANLGAAQHPKILKQFGGAYENEKLETVLALVTGRLVAQSKEPNRAYNITVLNSPAINAFALPGGYLYVTRGLLALANDAAEVAAVLAHEMAHVSSNHGVERNEQAKAVDIAERVASNVVSNPVVGQIVRASTERRLATFSQKQELEADAVGIKMLGKAGFDPYSAARFLKSMDRYAAWRSTTTSKDAQDMSSSHPTTPQRVELAQRHARLVGPPNIGEKNRSRYLQGVDGLLFGDSAKEGFIRGRQFLHKRLGFTFSVPNGFELSNRPKSVLASGAGEMALRFDAVGKEARSLNPADYLKSGWVNGLLPETVVPVSVNGLNGARGKAEAGDWRFSITVIRFKNRMYRFILAAPKAEQNVDGLGVEISGSFRTLNKQELARLKPQRIKIVKIKASDTLATMAARMGGVNRKVQLFKALNGIEDGQRLPKKGQAKLVVD